MTDMEKAIEGFKKAGEEAKTVIEKLVSIFEQYTTPVGTDDVIALLKEQKAVEPEVEVLNEIDRIYRCPKCHKCFFYEKQKYCDQCGQEVQWE